MIRLLSSSVLLTTSLAAGAVLTAPGAAHAADTTTKLSATAMAAALKKVAAASTDAAEPGWRATMSTTAGKETFTGTYLVDPAGKVVTTLIRYGSRRLEFHAVGGKGVYEYVNEPATRAAATMIGRPAVRYAFEKKAVKFDAYAEQNAPSPATLLTEDVDHAGTRTSHDNGSTDYRFTADKGVSVALHVDKAGVLTAARGVSAEGTSRLAYRYGAQDVKLPAASVTIDWPTLQRAMAYLRMPATVKSVAERAAVNTRRAADGKKVEVSSLRTIVRRDITAANKAGKVLMTVGDISGGVRIDATNPWTKQKASYAVTASGREVLVKKI